MLNHDPIPADELPAKPDNRLEISLLLVSLILPSVVTYLFFVVAAGLDSGLQRLIMAGCKVIQFVLPLVWWLGIRKRAVRIPVPTGIGWVWGAAFGLVVTVTMWVGYWFWIEPAGWIAQLPGHVAKKVAELGCDTKLRFVALGIFYSVVHSLLEEYYWRWFVFSGLKRYLSVATAVLVSSIGFMGHHVIVLATFLGWQSPATWIFSVAVGIGGAFWAWLYHRSQQLYPAWLSHLIVDAAIFLLGYWMLFVPS